MGRLSSDAYAGLETSGDLVVLRPLVRLWAWARVTRVLGLVSAGWLWFGFGSVSRVVVRVPVGSADAWSGDRLRVALGAAGVRVEVVACGRVEVTVVWDVVSAPMAAARGLWA